MVALVSPAHASTDPVSLLAQRLEDPDTAESLHTILDHADLLAVLVSGLDGLVRRGDTIIEAVADGVREVKSASDADVGTDQPVRKLATGLPQLAGPLADALPSIEQLLGALEPLTRLATRLQDPATSQALHTLLDHTDLLALMVSGLDGFIQRSDTIIESVADGVREATGAAGAGKPAGLPDAEQLGKLVTGMTALVGPLTEAMPTIERLLGSGMLDANLIDIATVGSQAVVEGSATARANKIQIKGVRKTLKILKDDDVARTFGFVATIAQVFGRKLRENDPASAGGPQHARPLPYAH